MRAALYLRLSREDGEEVSQSIGNQRLLLGQWAAQHNMDVTAEYIDDGWSGTDFQRPGFQRMLRDMEAGKLDAVLVKDLSRLGRDYIQTGYYLERYFPERGIRLVAVGDGIDTGEGRGLELAPFRSVLNDLYARDISQKVRAVLAAKRQQGRFVGSCAPYGYRRGEGGKLEPEQRTGQVVRRIFGLFLAGEGTTAIARRLEEEGIPSPGAEKGRSGGGWSGQMVRRILLNPVYVGDLAQGRSRRVSYKVKKRLYLPPEQWQVIRDSHTGLVSREQFRQAAQRLAARPRPSQGGEHSLAGLVFCGGCGGRMTFKISGGHCYLVCSRWNHNKSCCSSHSIREDAVEGAILAQLARLAEGVDRPALICQAAQRQKTAQKQRQHQREKVERARLQLYQDRMEGVVTEEEFRQLLEGLRRQQGRTEPKREEPDTSQWEEALGFRRPSRAAMLLLVRRVTVGEGEITVEWTFSPNPSKQ